MTATAIGLFDGFAEAQRMTQTLLAQGVPSADITIIANRQAAAVGDVLVAAAWGVTVEAGPASRGEPAAFLALGVPAGEVDPVAMALDGGGALVCVDAAEPRVDEVVALMERSTAEDLAVLAGS
jgi:hypothetical protein